MVRNGLTGQSPVEQLTSGHISPFNDGQGFFAQFDPSKVPPSMGGPLKVDQVFRCKELGACPPLGYWDPFGMMAFQAVGWTEICFPTSRWKKATFGIPWSTWIDKTLRFSSSVGFLALSEH